VWYKWIIHRVDGVCRFSAGTAYCRMSDALDAAMWSVTNSNDVVNSVDKIQIHTTK